MGGADATDSAANEHVAQADVTRERTANKTLNDSSQGENSRGAQWGFQRSVIRTSDSGRHGPDHEALAGIILSKNSSKEEVREYVANILLASKHQTVMGGDDPQIKMLSEVGPANLDVLLEYTNWEIGHFGDVAFYMRRAIRNILRPEHKAFVLKSLTDQPILNAGDLDAGFGRLPARIAPHRRRRVELDAVRVIRLDARLDTGVAETNGKIEHSLEGELGAREAHEAEVHGLKCRMAIPKCQSGCQFRLSSIPRSYTVYETSRNDLKSRLVTATIATIEATRSA